MLTADKISELEKKAFMLFRDECTEDHKRLIIYLVFKTIENNSGITRNRLDHILTTEYNLDSTTVAAGLGALTSKEIFNSVSAFKVTKVKCKPVMLRLKNNLDRIYAWLNVVEHENPTILEFESIKV